MCCADFNFYINRQGIQGRKGDKGDTGFSPTINVGTDTLNEYKLIIANESNSFETPNLRGNINVLDNGGTYLRYDTETQQISAQSMDAATADTLGGVRLSTSANIADMSAETVVTPADVADALPVYLEGEGVVTITQDEESSKTKINVDLSSVDELKTRVSTTEAEIVGIQADIANLDTDVSSLKDITASHTTSISSINDNITNLNNNKVAKTDFATTESAGIVKVDGITITTTEDGTISANSSYTLPIASTTQLGGVKVDGTSIIADENGVISSVGGGGTSDVPIATTEVAGKVKPDGTTITVTDDGTISAASSTPSNMVTTDTDQTITGNKTFSTSTTVTFGAGSAMTTIERDTIKIGDLKNYDLNISSTLLNDESGNPTVVAGCIRSRTGNINIVPNWSTQNHGDGLLIQENKLSFNGSEVVTKSDIATDTTAGVVKVDGTSVTINSDGVISATGSGSAPDNMVTTNTAQTITGIKTFNAARTVFKNGSSYLDAHRLEIGVGQSGTVQLGDYLRFNSGRSGADQYAYLEGKAYVNHLNSTSCWAFNVDPRFSNGKTGGENRDERKNYQPYLRFGNITAGNGITITETTVGSGIKSGIKIESSGSTNITSTDTSITATTSDTGVDLAVNKALVTGYAFPSTSYVDLTLGASGAQYTAPADGWVTICAKAANSLRINSAILYVQAPDSTGSTGLFFPVTKDQIFTVMYTSADVSASWNKFRFYYAEGAPSA